MINNLPAITKASPQSAFKPDARRAAFVKQLGQCVLVLWLAYASFLLISHFVLQSVEVDGSSMSPTLHPADRYFLNRLVYLYRSPQRSEIVVLRDPTDGVYAVKRVIAGAGDSVEIAGGKVFVNGKLLEEPYLDPGTPTYTLALRNELSVKCGKDEFFVLGDNRKNSSDSRVYGPVNRQNILGAIIH
ncbi:MAG: signal peptidase I [Verrucomicrobia bacterium]|nr:MAG: signal peptidase I [Verrucomicrobiota bacterium]